VQTSEDVLKLMQEFGMILPINYSLGLPCKIPSMYWLMVPKLQEWQQEQQNYGAPKFYYTNHEQINRGWSNVPIALWITSYLVQEGTLSCDCTWATKRHEEDRLKGSQNFLKPLEGGQEPTYSLFGFIKLLLYEEPSRELCDKIERSLKPLTKDLFYSDFKNFLKLDGEKFKLGQVKESSQRAPAAQAAAAYRGGGGGGSDAPAPAPAPAPAAPAGVPAAAPGQGGSGDGGGSGTPPSPQDVVTTSRLRNRDEMQHQKQKRFQEEQEEQLNQQKAKTTPKKRKIVQQPAAKVQEPAAKVQESAAKKPRAVQPTTTQVMELTTQTKKGSKTHYKEEHAPSMKSWLPDRVDQELYSSVNHFDLPPAHIKESPVLWASTLFQEDGKLDQAKEIGVTECEHAVVFKMTKLMFNYAATRYVHNQVAGGADAGISGEDLFKVLSCPEEDEQDWLESFQLLYRNLATFSITLKMPQTEPTEGEDFHEYFDRLCDSEWGVPEDEDTGAAENLEDMPPVYWSRSYAPSPRDFDLDVVAQTNQDLKCFILYNLMGCNFLKHRATSRQQGRMGSKVVFASSLSLMDYDDTDNVPLEVKKELIKDVKYEVGLWAWSFQDMPTSNFLPLPGDNESILPYYKRCLHTLRKMIKPSPPPPVPNTMLAVPREGKRPLCKHAVFADEHQLPYLHGLFFNHDGSLRRDLRGFLDYGEKHGFIKFAGTKSRDFRYMLPVLGDDSDDASTSSLFGKVRQFLVENNMLDIEKERLQDIAILIGGTTLQPLHEDFVPDVTKASKEKLEQVLNGPYSPASVLVGFGGRGRCTRLAIKKDVVSLETE
jgi:hypothetical protein